MQKKRNGYDGSVESEDSVRGSLDDIVIPESPPMELDSLRALAYLFVFCLVGATLAYCFAPNLIELLTMPNEAVESCGPEMY